MISARLPTTEPTARPSMVPMDTPMSGALISVQGEASVKGFAWLNRV
jgi:hypothetical protein